MLTHRLEFTQVFEINSPSHSRKIHFIRLVSIRIIKDTEWQKLIEDWLPSEDTAGKATFWIS